MAMERGNPRVRLLHTSPDAAAVDIYIDGKPSISNLAFGQVSDYQEVSPGKHSLRIFPAGSGGQGQEVLNADLEGLKAGEDYTTVVLGKTGHIHATLLHDSTAMPAAGSAKVRAVHAAPDAPAFDIAVAGGPAVVKNISYKHAADFVELPAGMVDLEVRPAGRSDTIMVVPDYTLAEGNIYTFVALGLLQGQPAFMIMPLVQAVEMRLPA